MRTSAAAAVLLLLPVLLPGAAIAEFSIEVVSPGVVRVMTLVDRGGGDGLEELGHGTGFVINDSGNVVTNNHVVSVEFEEQLSAVVQQVPEHTWDNRLPATVIWTSQDLDLAILDVPGLAGRPPMPLAIDEPAAGSQVWAVGYPGIAEDFSVNPDELLIPSVNFGAVGKVLDGAGDVNQGTILRLVQHDAEINPGNSGGPLFNACNQVLGINTFGPATFLEAQILRDPDTGEIRRDPETGDPLIVAWGDPPDGVNFAIHVSVLMAVLDEQGIAWTGIAGPCLLLPPSQTLTNLYIGGAALLAAIAILLSLRRPRVIIQEIGHRVADSYSRGRQRLRQDDRSLKASPGMATAAAAVAPAWVLRGTALPGQAVTVTITDDLMQRRPAGVVIGRGRALCDLAVDDRSVSRRHLRVRAAGIGTVEVEDLNSANGTRVDGQELAPAEVRAVGPGTEIAIGDVVLRLSRQG